MHILDPIDIMYVIARGFREMGCRTRVVKAVFPPPLGPTSKKVGRLVDAAAFLYRKLCSSIGNVSTMRKVMMMVVRFGERAAVSQLSSSYQAIATASCRASRGWKVQ